MWEDSTARLRLTESITHRRAHRPDAASHFCRCRVTTSQCTSRGLTPRNKGDAGLSLTGGTQRAAPMRSARAKLSPLSFLKGQSAALCAGRSRSTTTTTTTTTAGHPRTWRYHRRPQGGASLSVASWCISTASLLDGEQRKPIKRKKRGAHFKGVPSFSSSLQRKSLIQGCQLLTLAYLMSLQINQQNMCIRLFSKLLHPFEDCSNERCIAPKRFPWLHTAISLQFWNIFISDEISSSLWFSAATTTLLYLVDVRIKLIIERIGCGCNQEQVKEVHRLFSLSYAWVFNLFGLQWFWHHCQKWIQRDVNKSRCY